MDISEKPFACNDKNCNMTFANEDHLNLHQKKHSMSFDLELTAKEGTVLLGDQTPTPTSFFRNCEEVGLFQDLQNVNPFEETFKKALECTGAEASKLGPLSLISNDDTLHTPHIFPTVEGPIKDEIAVDNQDLMVTFGVKNEMINGSSLRVKESQENFKSKLKEALLKKDNQKNVQTSSSVIIAENFLLVNNNNTLNATPTSHISNRKHKASVKPQQKTQRPEAVREMNRAAQVRCRIKKKRLYDKMSTEWKTLQKENSELKTENTKLRQLNAELYELVKELGGADKVDFLDMLNFASIETEKSDVPEITLKKLPILAPAYTMLPMPTVKNSLLLPSPLVYNVVNVVGSSTNSMNKFSTSVPTLSPEVKKTKTPPNILKKT